MTSRTKILKRKKINEKRKSKSVRFAFTFFSPPEIKSTQNFNLQPAYNIIFIIGRSRYDATTQAWRYT